MKTRRSTRTLEKRKVTTNADSNEPKSNSSNKRKRNEEVSSDDDLISGDKNSSGDDDVEYDDSNNALLNKTKKLLLKTKESDEKTNKDESNEDDVKGNQQHPMRHAVSLHRPIADSIRCAKESCALILHKYHRLSLVCLCFSSDHKFLVGCSKDGTITKYDIEGRRKVVSLHCRKSNLHSHSGQVNCCAISTSSKYLATGGVDKLVKIWDFNSFTFLGEFKEHRGQITSLAFRKQINSNELFSSSSDRSIKIWDVDQMGIINTLYGHFDSIQQIDILGWPRVISCGGHDKTCRLFKIFEDSHLVFNSHFDSTSVDTISMINEEHFVTGTANGSVSVWSIARKKPTCTVQLAHGLTDNGVPRWISSVASHPYTDLVASGSHDGILKIWKISVDYKSLISMQELRIVGFINHIRFSDDTRYIACAVGQEHKSGRWWRIKEAKNCIALFTLYLASDKP